MQRFCQIVLLFFFSIRFSNLQEDVEDLREQEVIETVRKMSGAAEFVWELGGDCAACIDLDKVLILKGRRSYEGFWKKIVFLQVSRVYPVFGSDQDGVLEDIECTRENYPDCNLISIISEEFVGTGVSNFVALCRKDGESGRVQDKCELGKLIVGYEKK